MVKKEPFFRAFNLKKKLNSLTVKGILAVYTLRSVDNASLRLVVWR